MDSFQKQWINNVKTKNTTLCAGLDPRSGEGYAQGAELVKWGKEYLKSVIEYVSAIKPNPKFWWGSEEEHKQLREILEYAKEIDPNILIIYDEKFSDIGATNREGIKNVSRYFPIDAVTISQFAGNMSQSVSYAKENNLGSFVMCLMTNPEFELEKRALFPIKEKDTIKYDPKSLKKIDGIWYVPNYLRWAQEAKESKATGVVIGTTNHITPEEVRKATSQLGEDMLILAPGLGRQGGTLESFKRASVNLERVIVNISSGLMYPNGPSSTPLDQEKAASHYLNLVRKKYFESNRAP